MDTRIRSKNDIVDFFRSSAVPKKDLMMGIEVERSGILEDSLSPVNYFGKGGYLDIFKKLVKEVGWKVIEQDEEGNIYSLKRGESFLNTENDGRMELSTKPRKTLFSLEREFRLHEKEINEISKYFGARWISMGFQPFAKNSEISLIPKERVKILSKYFREKQGGSHYLKKTNSIHINFGYVSEEFAILKFQIMYRIAPIIAAIFANSPLNSGRFSGYMCNRLNISQNFDPKRNGPKKEFFDSDFDFERWVDFTLTQDLFYIFRKNKAIKMPKGFTFLDFLEKGYKNIRPMPKDYFLHIKSIWNEVRIKSYIEFRTIDCVPPSLIKSTLALVKGIAFSKDFLKEAGKLTEKLSFEEYMELRDNVNKYALQARIGKLKVLDLAKELLNISSEGLKKITRENNLRHNETRFLWPIKEYVFVREQSPAEFVMEMWNGPWHKDKRRLLEWSEK